jgi:tryptophan synthase beta chain
VKSLPDARGHFELFGGKYVPEALMAALTQLEAEFDAAMGDPSFWAEFDALRSDYAGRPTPLTDAPQFSKLCGNAQIVLKREDLNHTGSH